MVFFLCLQDIFSGKSSAERSDVFGSLEDEAYEGYEKVKKDINALTKEEQMDVVYRYSSYSSWMTVLIINLSVVLESPIWF